jgi:hypothetical protein
LDFQRPRKACIDIEAHQRQDRREEIGYGVGFADTFSAILTGLPNHFSAEIASRQDDGRHLGKMNSLTSRVDARRSTELPHPDDCKSSNSATQGCSNC